MGKYSVGELIYKKRKEKGLTQSQLGEMLGVSNKAVSKWENGESFPEFSAIQPLCEILGITADELVQGKESQNDKINNEVENNEKQQPKQKLQMSEKGKKFEKKFFAAIAIGVFLCIFSVATLFLSQLLGASGRVSVCLLLLCVAVGVFLFIAFGMKYDHYKAGCPDEFVDMCQKYAYILAVGVAMCILSPCMILLGYNETHGHHSELLTMTLFFIWIAVAVLLIVFAGLGVDKTKKQWDIKDGTKKETWHDKACGMIMMGALAIFLLCGFVWGIWHPAWVAFPVGGIICGIVGSTKKDDD